MKNIFTLLLCVLGVTAYGQNGIIGSGFTPGWNIPGDIVGMSAGAGGSRIVTRNPNGTGNQYFRMVTLWDGVNTQWGPNAAGPDVLYTAGTSIVPVVNNGTGAYLIDCPNTSDNFVFKTRGGGNPPSSPALVVFRVQGDVRTVTAVNQSPTTVYPGQGVTVTATLSGAFPTGQGAYLRYTNDNYATSTVVEMTGSGTSYSASILAGTNTASSNLSYYVFTSGSGLTIAAGDADFFTINLNNNGGSNYTYAVVANYATTQAGDWTDASTWVAGVQPVSGQPIAINHNVTLNTDASASSVAIAVSTTLTVASTRVLSVTGGVSGTGSFVVNGTFRLNAGGFTNITPTYGAGTSTLTYNTGGNYNISNEWPAASSPASIRIINSSVVLSGNRNVTGLLDIESGGSLDVNGHTLSLKATSESAYSQLLNNGTLTGNVTFERAITGSTQGWRFISPPVSNTLANFGTVQLTGAANVISMNTANPNAWVAQGGAGTDALVAGRGYALYFGNTGVNNNDVATTLSLTGAIQNADVTVAGLSDGNGTNDFGWTLVGNPFPSGLDWSNVNHTKTNIADAYYIWNPTLGGSGQYASFVAGVSNPVGALDANIPPMQGFFVKATAASPVLTFSAQGRTSGATKAQLRTSNYANLLQIRVTNEVNGIWDETAIASRSNATAAYEDSYDAFKLNSFNADAVNLSSLSSDQRKLSINSTSLWDHQTTIPLYLTSSQAVAMRMTVDLDEVDAATPVFLEDLLLNQFHDLRTGDYHFVHQIGQHNRFIIHFNNLAAASIPQNTMERALVYAFEGALYVKGLQGAAAVRMMDMQGRVVFEAQNTNVDAAMLLPQLAKGTYLVQVQQGQSIKTVKLIF